MKSKTRRRATRIRNELRLWLRSNFGHRISYAQKQIDIGREELGFRSADDALIAYSLFGADLSPNVLDALEPNLEMEDLDGLLTNIADEPGVEWDCINDT